MASYKTARTPTLEIAYYEHGSLEGWPVVLTHGFPYDIHAFDEVVPLLTSQGARVIVPYLRGYGPTRFLSSSSIRSGQQAALGSDLISLLDALHIDKAIVSGFDWGGVASCVAAALWPERIAGLVTYAGYDIIDREGQKDPVDPGLECVVWYQHLFQTERGRECLRRDRKKLCRLLWAQWSPKWRFTDEMYERTAASFENADFVDVVIQAYRFCMCNEAGDPALETFEEKLAMKPKITVPTITLDGTQDPLKPGGTSAHAKMFTGRYERAEVAAGHAIPHEAPEVWAKAILDMHQRLSASIAP
ncbi:putative hydrolase [Thozetella sp. PMI_491]|nr:putative hydrolase [Thozetella sp. PMI_491]